MAEISKLNGYALKDAQARSDIAGIKDGTIKAGKAGVADSASYTSTAGSAQQAYYYKKVQGDGTDKTIETKFGEVEQTIQNVANGVNRGYSFDSIDKLIGDLEGQGGPSKYKIGDELYIKSADKPDYWVAEVKTEPGPSGVTSISDGATVGYWVLYKLGEKTDLSQYQKINDAALDTTNKTVVGAINELNTKAATMGQALQSGDFVVGKANEAKNAINGLSVSGRTITYTKGDGTKGTITTQDTNTTYTAGYGLHLDGTMFEVMPATQETYGGIKTGFSSSGRYYAVELDDYDKAFVYVPWTDTNTTYSAGIGLSLVGNTFGLVFADNNTLGGIRLGYTQTGRNYPVMVDTDKKAYVNVPWSDTIYTLPAATTTVRGGVKVGAVRSSAITTNAASSDAGRYYAVERDSNEKLFVNVPWANTTYSLATQSANGLMSAADKTKLDKIGISIVGEEMTITVG